jgi:hypothetical protein
MLRHAFDKGRYESHLNVQSCTLMEWIAFACVPKAARPTLPLTPVLDTGRRSRLVTARTDASPKSDHSNPEQRSCANPSFSKPGSRGSSKAGVIQDIGSVFPVK